MLQLLVLIGLAAAIVAAVRFLVIAGIELVCRRFAFSSKTKGQLIGYTTSLPEFVVILSSALGGVFDVGLWNIASSNIINWVLFLANVYEAIQIVRPAGVDVHTGVEDQTGRKSRSLLEIFVAEARRGLMAVS